MRWLIGVELARYRKRSGETLAAAAKAIGCSPSLVGHFEKGMYFPQPQQIAGLLEFYGAPTWDIDRLASLCGRADQRTWLAPWVDVIPDWLRTFVGLEGLAIREITYAPLVLPALVQTSEYAVAMTSPSSRVRPDQGERLVSLRMERQQRLFCETSPLHLTALIEESVLDRPIGGTAIMKEQLERLVTISELPNVEVLIVPTVVGRHDGLEGRFTVLDFDEAQSIGYVEIPDGAVYVQDQEQVGAYSHNAEALRSVALSQAESAKAVRARADALA
ncbi:helix-turn-helix domain-containing protein [Haloactinomyces albus]|uniref:Transcriptional regulator with XRE-family HTH domain n=1 Tax=Haloactinomyces albus TaxID=1352928 RepID=A0AAE4CK65_9ACTN|nr:helix-turn-helix transcriptional regulator [Haloactinomyces albus]MDR7299996.1 transcriptional regulator with XRE-family HTH domain [Haloactinomyces albus]